jgi:hypothetical protein
MFTRTLSLTALVIALMPVPGRLAAQAAPAPAGADTGQQFSIMIWETPAQLALRTDAAKGGAYWSAFAQYGAELQKAGILRGGAALRTGDAVRTVTVRKGATRVRTASEARTGTDLGGYFIIEVATLDDAVRWAARIPSALTGAVEVRPAYPAPTMMK